MFSTVNERQAPEDLIQIAKQQLHDVLMHVKGVDYIMICSSDGFELESISYRTGFNSSKLAAVSSSILAMVSAFLTEIQLTGCQNITLDADNGKAILTAINSSKYPMVIVTLASKDVLLGQLLYSLKQAREHILQYQT